MSPCAASATRAAPRFPRVSGDEPALRESPTVRTGFSPRERG